MEIRLSENESGSDNPQWQDMAAGNSIVITDGRITDSRFTASWSGRDTDDASAAATSMRGYKGSMAGAFYGPNGEEVAGVVSGARGDDWLVQGAIVGTKDAGG